MIRSVLIGFIFLIIPVSTLAQDTTTVKAKSEDISENLDLQAVASVFGEAEDLEDFEKRLNDPEAQITNLDMNNDGNVDYLRVLETVKDETHFISIQAVLGDDQFQDVATIEVEKDSSGETQVQVVGDVYMYGPNYIVEPVYVRPPVVFAIFWTPYYSPWYSPWYWGHRPPYYRPWRPYPTHRYRTNVNVHINVNNSYNYTSVRRSKTSVQLQNKNRRNDFGKKHPDQSFKKRNPGVENRNKLSPKDSSRKDLPKKESTRKVQDDWKPSSERGEKGNRSKEGPKGKRDAPKNGNSQVKPVPKTKQTPKAKPTPRAKPAPKEKQKKAPPVRPKQKKRR
ncbi:MAG: hypothetical protein GY780_15905 [bacterium]|nr:hypothetical protein [bacterium]